MWDPNCGGLSHTYVNLILESTYTPEQPASILSCNVFILNKYYHPE